jgi:L-alanine-DL-glutamate epimerase and related enzymes of enolase superfamily
MKVTHTAAVRWDVPMRAPYRSAQRITTTARNVLVTVTLEDGSRGYGESAPATYVTGETQESVVSALEAFLGVAPRDAEAMLAAARQQLAHTPGGLGALETALLDALARSEGVPLYRRLNPDARPDRADRSTDLSLPLLPPEEASVRASEAAAQGFTALKIKVGGAEGVEVDEARVRAVAEAAPRARLRLDGNQGFTQDAAVQFAGRLADLADRIEMLEQPTPAGDDAALRYVAARVPYPVYADESCHGPEDARRLIEGRICGGIVLKLAKTGLRRTLDTARAAHDVGGRCLFGCMMETRVAIGAALHAALALGDEIVPLLDLDGHLLVRDDALLDGGVAQQGEFLAADATAPGLGLTVTASA